MEHEFTKKIFEVLKKNFGDKATDVYRNSSLLQYINIKTRSANRGSKSRGSFANLYAIYVLAEDYLAREFDKQGDYEKYEGAKFSVLFTRQRELPFGRKLQNHALNHRMNEEFKKYFSNEEAVPIIREPETNRYWFNQSLLKVEVAKTTYNLAKSVIQIIDLYIETKKSAFESFIQDCEKLKSITGKGKSEIESYITGLLQPNVDARLFEVVSYSILKYFYHDQVVYFGFQRDKITEEKLKLFKTGRTNANDGGIDFVMKPLGRFFQVTETLDVKKYFLDIDKIERFPISFVVKSEDSVASIKKALESDAKKLYSIDAVVKKYMNCIEEICNIPRLKECFQKVVKDGHLSGVLDEIILQSKVEFNYEEEVEGDEEEV